MQKFKNLRVKKIKKRKSSIISKNDNFTSFKEAHKQQ